MRQVLEGLRAASLLGDIEQLRDALWLARVLPAGDAAAPPGAAAPASTRAVADRSSAGTASSSAGASGRQTFDDQREVTIALRKSTPPDHAPGLFGQGATDDAGTLRARIVRVAGVPALPNAHALALALRPLGRRRESLRERQFDEEATIERFAETLTLLPQFSPRRERFFDALLLVDDSPAAPLWRTTVDELEQLLRRRVGWRSFRRLDLDTRTGPPRTRTRTGVGGSPSLALEGDAPLVLIATDGTTEAWSDGRIAAMLGALGPLAALVVLQLLPERLWQNTALGRAEAQVRSPSAGAPLSRLRVAWAPDLDGPEEDVDTSEAGHAPADAPPPLPVALPVVALQAADLGRWARMQMAGHGVSTRAALLWPAAPSPASPGEVMPPANGVGNGAEARADDADECVARARGVVPDRVLQAAIHLSAAAPLTLAIVRLVQRVMQPDAPAGDLPLLLLSGLLERVGEPAGQAASDDTLGFEFAPGVRALLQRSLLKSDVAQIRHDVSAYIAERTGLPYSFAALIEDPDGALLLPAWARPFAEVCRDVDRLFEGAPRPGEDALPDQVREVERAPGVTVRAVLDGVREVSQLRYSPDGTRLAVRHAGGIATWRLPRAGDRALAPVRDPVVLRRDPELLIVKGWGVDDAQLEEAIGALRASLGSMFTGRWEVRYHTHLMEDTEARRIASTDEAAHVANLARKTRSVVVALGSVAFMDSLWMRKLKSELASRATRLVALFELSPPTHGFHPWRLEGPWDSIATDGPARYAGQITAQWIQLYAEKWTGLFPLLDPLSIGMAWWSRIDAKSNEDAVRDVVGHTLISADTGPKAWVADGEMVLPPLSELLGVGGQLQWFDTYPENRRLVLAKDTEIRLWYLPPGKQPQLSNAINDVLGWRAIAWSPTNLWLAIIRPGALEVLDEGWNKVFTETLSSDDEALLAWSADGRFLAVATRGTVSIREPGANRAEPQWETLPMDYQPVTSMAWSLDNRFLACAGGKGKRAIFILYAPNLEYTVAAWKVTSSSYTAAFIQSPFHVAFSPVPLDATFLELAVLEGNRVELLRVNPKVLVAAAAPRDDDDRLEAALRVLQALALVFHVGGIVAREGAFDDWLRQIGDEEGVYDGNRLAHWKRISEYVFWGPVRTVLMTGEDPVVIRDEQAARETGRTLLEEWRKNVAEHDPRALMTVWKTRRLAIATDALRMHDPNHYLSLGGKVLDDYFDFVEQVYRESVGVTQRKQPVDPKEAVVRQREQEKAISTILAQPDADLWLGRYAGAFHAVFGTSGRSDFSRADNYVTYLQRLFAYWRETSERAFRHASPDGFDVEMPITYPTPAKHLDRIASDAQLSEPVRYKARDVDETGQATAWSVTRRSYLELIDQLGKIVVDAVRRRLFRPAHRPRVLWVTNDPEDANLEVSRLQQRGGEIVLSAYDAIGTALDHGEHFDACVIDLRNERYRSLWRDVADTLIHYSHGATVILFASERQVEGNAMAFGEFLDIVPTFDAEALDDQLLRTLRRRSARLPA
jgi:hypothetical protein